jgi:hypothetical protein
LPLIFPVALVVEDNPPDKAKFAVALADKELDPLILDETANAPVIFAPGIFELPEILDPSE